MFKCALGSIMCAPMYVCDGFLEMFGNINNNLCFVMSSLYLTLLIIIE